MDGPFRHSRVEKILTAGTATVHREASLVNQSLVFNFKQGQSSLLPSLWISLSVLLHLHLRKEALDPVEKHGIGTKSKTVRSGSHHGAHETHSVFNVVLQEQIVNEAGLALRTASVEPGVSHYHDHHSRQSAARVLLIRVFKLIESCISSEAVVVHGYL